MARINFVQVALPASALLILLGLLLKSNHPEG